MKFNEKVNIVTDCDEVLTDISPLWLQKIFNNKKYFSRYYNLPEKYNYKTEEGYKYALSRPIFYMDDWLLKKDIKLSEKESKELFQRFYSLYDNNDFYAECEPTKMCEGIFKLTLQKYINKVYILTRTTDGSREGKEKFLKTFLNSPKVEIIFVGKDEKKSDYINKIDNVRMIVEDELTNINDILDNCPNLKECDFFVPYTGYNDPNAELFNKADKKKIKLLYYPIFEETEIAI